MNTDSLMHTCSPREIEWEISNGLVSYQDAIQVMEQRVEEIINHSKDEKVWFLEHPSIYTLGTSAKFEDVLNHTSFPVIETGRGGQVTYHGPGQRVGYVMLDLNQRQKDLRAYIWHLEEWLILTLRELGIEALRRDGRVGLWVLRDGGREDKIAAIGVRVRKWVTYHGFALNVCPELDHYQGIVPCGIREHGVTSLEKLGVDIGMSEIDMLLKKTFAKVF